MELGQNRGKTFKIEQVFLLNAKEKHHQKINGV